jgi:hypothetical protein
MCGCASRIFSKSFLAEKQDNQEIEFHYQEADRSVRLRSEVTGDENLSHRRVWIVTLDHELAAAESQVGA